MRDDFAVFILSHGRADRIYTLPTLNKGNYSGKWYIVIDDEDKEESKYRKKYGDHVVQFCKADLMERTDTLDNFDKHGAVVYARNYCHELAVSLGLRYYLVLDDDYTAIMSRKNVEGKLKGYDCKNLDAVFSAMLEFLEVSGALSVAFAQGGDFIGGAAGAKKEVSRKVMNSFFCSTERPFQFMGSINEDLNASVLLGMRGGLFMTVFKIMLCQKQTQANANGLTTIYKDLGTFVKSFYSVIVAPSCVKVAVMGDNYKRIHHRVNWTNAVPVIVSSRYRK